MSGPSCRGSAVCSREQGNLEMAPTPQGHRGRGQVTPSWGKIIINKNGHSRVSQIACIDHIYNRISPTFTESLYNQESPDDKQFGWNLGWERSDLRKRWLSESLLDLKTFAMGMIDIFVDVLIVAEDPNFKPPKNGWKAKRKAVTRTFSPAEHTQPLQHLSGSLHGEDCGGSPTVEGGAPRSPVCSVLRSPGKRGMRGGDTRV